MRGGGGLVDGGEGARSLSSPSVCVCVCVCVEG